MTLQHRSAEGGALRRLGGDDATGSRTPDGLLAAVEAQHGPHEAVSLPPGSTEDLLVEVATSGAPFALSGNHLTTAQNRPREKRLQMRKGRTWDSSGLHGA